jgi:rod shape determining protein RodA
LGVNYSTIQSKIAVGSAGWLGKGYGQGTQVQLGFLPAA